MPPSTPARTSPLDALWRSEVILWVLVGGEGLAIALSLAPGLDRDRWLVYFGLASFWIQWVALLTLGSLYVLRGLLRDVSPPGVAGVALLFSLLYCVLLALVARVLVESSGARLLLDWNGLMLKALGITLTVGLLGLAAFQNHWQGQIHALHAKQYELEALQARIRPHFLFNTLNTGAALVHQRPEDAERVLLDLADLFRAALAGPQQLALADELALTRRYLDIESLRFGHRLRVTWEVPDPVPLADLPTLSIQPLVENAVRHGVEPDPDGGTIRIQVQESERWILVTVQNSVPAKTTPTPGHQIGQNAVRARILAFTQGRGALDVQAEDARYSAVIRLPKTG
ncbi:sensor histidine kinase [Pseudoxanthomonas beigongshangi]